MQALSDKSRVVTLADLNAFDSQFSKQTTTPTVSQDQSRIVTQADLDALDAPGYRWQAPPPSAPMETLEAARIPAVSEGEAAAAKVTRLENVTRPVKRISLEGQGEFLKALGADIINTAIDGKPTLENLHAAWKTEQLPIDEQLAQQAGLGATIARGIGGVVGSVPSLIEGGAIGKVAGAALNAPQFASSLGFGAAMGSETYSRSQGDWEQAMKSAAVGAAFPVVGRWAANTGSSVAKWAVSKGVPLAERQTMQKAVEFGIEQIALQSFNHVISAPEYLDIYSQGGADAVKQAILENTIALGVYAIPGIVRTLSPRFPSELARTIAEKARADLDKAIKTTVEIPDWRKRLADEQQAALEKAATVPARPVEPPKESEVSNAVPELGRSIVPEAQKAGGVPPVEAQVRPPEARPIAGQAEAGIRPPGEIAPIVPLKEVIPSETQVQRQGQVEQGPPVKAPVAPTIAREPTPPSEATLRPPTPLAAQELPGRPIVAPPVAEVPKPPTILNIGIPLEHRGGEVPETPQAKAGMKLLTKAVSDLGDIAKRFTGVKFDKSTGFGLEVRSDDPFTLVVNPEQLHKSAKIIRERYRGGMKAALDEEVVHSFVHEVCNALEIVDPGFRERMAGEMEKRAADDVRRIRGIKEGPVETALEFIRMKIQRKRSILTESFTQQLKVLDKYPITQTMRDLLGGVRDFFQKVFGDKKPTAIQSVMDASLKLMDEFKKKQAESKTAAGATEVQDYSSALKPKGKRVTKWTAKQNAIVSEAMKDPKFAPWVAELDQTLRPIVQSASKGDEELTRIAIDYLRYKKLPEWASHFQATGKAEVGNVGMLLSKVRSLEEFKQRSAEIEGQAAIAPTEDRPEGRQIAAEAPTPDELAMRAEDAAPATGPQTPLESIVREFIQRREAKGVLETEDILELKAALEALGLPKKEIINAAKRIVTRAASPEELDRELKAVPDARMVASILLDPRLAKNQEEDTLRRTVVSVVAGLDNQARAEFANLPPGAQAELSGVKNAVDVFDIASGRVGQRAAVAPAAPYTIGQKTPGPVRQWLERVARTITDPERRADVVHSMLTAATESMKARYVESFDIQTRYTKALKDLMAFSGRIARMGKDTIRAQNFTDLAQDIHDAYLKKLTDGIAALRDRATLTGAEEALSYEYKRELKVLQDQFRSQALRSSIVDAYDTLVKAGAFDNQSLSSKDIAQIIVKAKPANIPSDRLRLVAKMMSEYVGLHQRLSTIHNIGLMPSVVFSQAHATLLKELQAATTPRAFLSVLNKYANAKGKAKALWDSIKQSERDFQKAWQNAENLSIASEYMQNLVNSDSFRNRMAELSDLNDVHIQLVKTEDGQGQLERRIIPNPNPVPTDPAAAANYVKEVVIDPWNELSEAKAEENLNACLKARDFFIEYLNNGRDPIMLRSVEQQLLKLNSMDLNPDFLPKFKRAFKPVPAWMDIHRWMTGHLHTPEYLGYFIPGRMGQMYNAALERWSETRARAATAINDYSKPAEMLSADAAKEHGMNIQEWIDEVCNPILSSYSAEGLTPVIKGSRLFNSEIQITAKDMAAIRAQHLLFTELVRRGFPENDPLFASEPLRIMLDQLDLRRKAYGLTSFMVPRRFMRDAIGWANDWLIKAKPDADNPSGKWEIRWNQLSTAQQNGLLDFLNDRRRFKLIVLSHLETIYQRPKYTIRSPLESVYREYLLKRIEEPGRFTVKTVQELADKLVALGASDPQGNPLSASDVVTILTGEINQAMRGLSDDVVKRRAADKTPDILKIETADNFTTIPRGNLVAPEGMYDYSLATGAQHMNIYSQIQRPYLLRYVSSLKSVAKSFADERDRMDSVAKEMLPKGATTTQIGKQAQRFSRKEWEQGKFWMDYNDVSRMAKWTERMLNQTMTFVNDYSSRLNEALMGYNIAGRAITSSLISQETAIIRNRLGSPLIGMWRSMAVGQNDIPWVENQTANDLMDAAQRVPVTGDVLRAGTRTLKDGVDFVSAMRNFVLRTASKTGWGKTFLDSVKRNPTAWGKWATDTMNAMVKARGDYEDDIRLGIVSKANVWNTIQSNLRFLGGNLETKPQTATERAIGVAKSAGNIATSTALGGWAIQAAENSANMYAAREARSRVAWLEHQVTWASGNRSMAGVDPAMTRLTPQEVFKSRYATEKELARLKEEFGPAIKLDYVILRYIKELQDAKSKGQPIESVHLLNDGEMDYYMTRVANKYNRQTIANRSMAFKNPITRFFSQLMGYGFWLTQEFSFMRSKLMLDEGKFDRSFTTSRMLLYTLMFGAATVPLFDWLAEHLKNKERSIPSLAKSSPGDWLPVIFTQSQGFMPTLMQFAAGIPSAFGAVRYNVNTGISVVPLQMGNNVFNWMKEIVQTHNAYRPTVKFLAQSIPNSQFLINNIAGMEFLGNRLVQDSKTGLRTAFQLSHTEMPPMMMGSAPGRMTPVTPVIDRLVNYMNLPTPDWNMVMEIRNQAMAMLMEKGETDPANTVNRMVMARAPLQAVAGRQLSVAELAAVQSKMTESALAKTQQVESNFAQYAAITGASAPAALTMPKPSRKDMPAGGGATYATGGGGGPPAGFGGGMVGGIGGVTMARPSALLAGPRARRIGIGRGRRVRVSIRRPTVMRRPLARRRMVRVVTQRRFRLR